MISNDTKEMRDNLKYCRLRDDLNDYLAFGIETESVVLEDFALVEWLQVEDFDLFGALHQIPFTDFDVRHIGSLLAANVHQLVQSQLPQDEEQQFRVVLLEVQVLGEGLQWELELLITKQFSY